MFNADERIASAPATYRSMFEGNVAPRFAAVHGARSVKEVEAYLPRGYAVMESFLIPPTERRLVVVIGGQDDAGWTLDDYVSPRLASGLMVCEEIPTPWDAKPEVSPYGPETAEGGLIGQQPY